MSSCICSQPCRPRQPGSQWQKAFTSDMSTENKVSGNWKKDHNFTEPSAVDSSPCLVNDNEIIQSLTLIMEACSILRKPLSWKPTVFWSKGGQYHGCWWPGSLRHQFIFTYEIDNAKLGYSTFPWDSLVKCQTCECISTTCHISMSRMNSSLIVALWHHMAS